MVKERIWEVDALRGLLIPGMVAIHLIYDVVDLYRFVDWPYPMWYYYFKNNFGALFVLLSGLSVTLGRRSVRRGWTVFLCGMICTAVTWGMYRFGMAGRGIIIYFGVLHCLGVCMMLWPVFGKLPNWAMAFLGMVLIALGWYLRGCWLDGVSWALLPLGLRRPEFASSDYFPLMPNLGYFLLGAVAGRLLYREKKSRWPSAPAGHPVIRSLRWCGEHSLAIYLLHQPVLAGLCELYAWLVR